MPVGAILGAAAPVVGGLLGKAIGGGGPKNAQPALPKDLQPLRQQNIGLLQYLLGMNQGPWGGQPQSPMPQMPGQMPGGGYAQNPGNPGRGTDWGPQYPGMQTGPVPNIGIGGMGSGMVGGMSSFGMDPATRARYQSQVQPTTGGPFGLPGSWTATGVRPAPGPMDHIAMSFGGGVAPAPGGSVGRVPGGMLSEGFGRAPTPYGQQPGGGFSSQLPQAPANNAVLNRMEGFFGPLGTPTTALQQQSLGGISQFLGSNPYGQSNNALQQLLGTPGRDFFGGAQGAFNDVKNANYFGGAKNQFNKAGGAFDKVGNANYFGKAEGAFNRLENYNPFRPAQGMLEGMFKQNPGQGTMEAMNPLYQRALAQANQEGGRFGSANAILRSRALDDYALMMQQAMQRGVDQQIQGAGVYGNMGNSLIGARTAAGQGMLGVGQGRLQQGLGAAQGQLGVGQGLLGVGQGQLQQGLGAAQGLLGVGQGRSSYDLGIRNNQLGIAGQLANNQNSMFNNLNSAYNVGGQQATQEAQRQQQALAIMQGLLGTSMGATLGAPMVVSPTGAQQGAQMGGSIGQILAQYLGNRGGGIPAAPEGMGVQGNPGLPEQVAAAPDLTYLLGG